MNVAEAHAQQAGEQFPREGVEGGRIDLHRTRALGRLHGIARRAVIEGRQDDDLRLLLKQREGLRYGKRVHAHCHVFAVIFKNAERQHNGRIGLDGGTDLGGQHHFIAHGQFLSTGWKTCPSLRPVERGRKTPGLRESGVASVEIIDVRKSYGDQEVIHGVSIPISNGEFVALVGPSGCGKSTLLRMIAGLEEISGGSIRIGERVVNGLPPKDRDIAMVFQNYALYPHKTVAENMGFALKLRKTPKAEIDARVLKAAEILDLVPYLKRYPRQLSGGQRQRVAMGRAIVRAPQVFLFDEPLSNLDAKLRVQMRAEIKELHQRLKTTTIYVTHDQVEAMTMADKIVVLHDGIVEQMGSPLDLYDRPANLFVAGFIGSPAMNMFKGVIRGGGQPYFEAADGTHLPLASAPPGSDGLEAVYGIRPEHLTLGGGLTCQVAVIEPTGSETQVIAKLAGEKFIGVFRERVNVAPGKPIAMSPDLSLVHLFDAKTGRRIS